MTPSLPSLAHRVETEPPSLALAEDIARALGWSKPPYYWWKSPDGTCRATLPNWLTDLSAAASLMPEGWQVQSFQTYSKWWVKATLLIIAEERYIAVDSCAPTEPQARTAAALRAKDAERA